MGVERDGGNVGLDLYMSGTSSQERVAHCNADSPCPRHMYQSGGLLDAIRELFVSISPGGAVVDQTPEFMNPVWNTDE